MDYFWKENKKYLIAVAAGVAFAFVFNLFVLSPLKANSEKVARDRRIKENEFAAAVKAGVPTEDTLGLARNELRRTKDLLGSLRDELVFKEAERFQKPPGGETLKAHYLFLKDDLYKELKSKASALGLFPPNFMLEAAGDLIPDELARELLVRLAIVERLVLLAVESKVDRIEQIDALSGVDRKEEPVTKKGGFLNKYSVYMKVKGNSQSIFKLLHGTQKKGSFLAVSQFECVQEDPSKDLFSAGITVSLLRVNEAASLEGEAP